VAWNLYSYLCQALSLGDNQSSLVFVGAALLCIIVPYLIGSINPSIIISRKIYKEDIRSYGSGNAGATNTLRTFGKKTAALIFVLDLLKAALAVGIGSLILTRSIGGAIAGLFVILGHAFPIYYKFQGGKGVACTAMVMLLLSPASFVLLFPAFIVIVALTRFVSLGSIIAVMLYPFFNSIFYTSEGFITLSAFCTMMLVVFMHRENIKRLLEGKESKVNFGRSRAEKQAKKEELEKKRAERAARTEKDKE
jgi:glycerol-3-phosphate acyltransferase PlsY